MDIEHQKENNRYILKVNDDFAKIDYIIKNNVMYLIHSEVPQNLRGKGIGKILVEQTFEKLTQQGYKAIAVCGYIKSIAKRSEKWKSIVS